MDRYEQRLERALEARRARRLAATDGKPKETRPGVVGTLLTGLLLIGAAVLFDRLAPPNGLTRDLTPFVTLFAVVSVAQEAIVRAVRKRSLAPSLVAVLLVGSVAWLVYREYGFGRSVYLASALGGILLSKGLGWLSRWWSRRKASRIALSSG